MPEPEQPSPIEDLPEIRDELQKHWQSAAMDLVRRVFRPEAVFETVLTVGLAGQVELHGKDATARKLIFIAEQLAEQVRKEAEAMVEAERSTKN